MRSTFALIGVIITATGADAQTQATRIAPQKGWHLTLEGGRAEARKTGKPLMVVFRCDP